MKFSLDEHKVIDAMARAFYVCAWADREEERKRSYPGCDLMDVAPKTPRYARDFAIRYLGKLEVMNGLSLMAILYRAGIADGINCDMVNENGVSIPPYFEDIWLKNFGHYTAMMALGHGVSWFDDHGEFEYKVPHTEAYLS